MAPTSGPIESATWSVFRGLSALRGKRIFHPHGVGFTATFTPHAGSTTGARLFDEQGPRRAIVRLSRAVGLPEPLPDALGLAIRIPDAYDIGHHQDFLLVTSARFPFGRHLLLPAAGFMGATYSSLLPYRLGGRLVVVGAFPSSSGWVGPGLSTMRQRKVGELAFELAVARPWGGWTQAATVELGRRQPDQEAEELRFDPSNTGGGIELAGLINQLRRPAYRASQEGRLSSPWSHSHDSRPAGLGGQSPGKLRGATRALS